MHDAFAVGIVDRGANGLDDLDALLERNVARANVLVELLARDELHRVVQRRVVEPRLVQRGDVRMPQLRDQVHFVLEVRLA